MKFPKKYKAPKVQSLAARSGVAWGDCSPGGSPGGGACGYNGMSAAGASCTDIGWTATGCALGAFP
ncbi:MAG: hypothetical protein ACYSU0_09585 [Planctomycetota bacterium]|jgi:hypothetical protein